MFLNTKTFRRVFPNCSICMLKLRQKDPHPTPCWHGGGVTFPCTVDFMDLRLRADSVGQEVMDVTLQGKLRTSQLRYTTFNLHQHRQRLAYMTVFMEH